jgi:hypothetical protein
VLKDRRMAAEQPHITAQDLRTALGTGADKGARRSRSVLPGAPDPPGWDWDTGKTAELDALQDTVDRQRQELERLRRAADDLDADARKAQLALAELAKAPFGRRRGVIAALRERGLLG